MLTTSSDKTQKALIGDGYLAIALEAGWYVFTKDSHLTSRESTR